MTTEIEEEKITGLVAIEDKNALVILTTGLDDLLNGVRAKVENDVADISKKKGRDEIVSNAFKVTKSKTYIEGKINDLIAQKKEEIKPTLEIIETLKGNKKKSNETLSQLARDTRSVITKWEAEQREIEAARVAREAAEKLAIEIAACEELAGFMDADFDRIEMERAKQIEESKIAHAKEVKRLDVKAEAERVEREKQLAEKAAEDARLAEKKRQDDEAAQIESDRLAREEDIKHASEIMKQAKETLMKSAEVDEKTARRVILAIKNECVENVSIQF